MQKRKVIIITLVLTLLIFFIVVVSYFLKNKQKNYVIDLKTEVSDSSKNILTNISNSGCDAVLNEEQKKNCFNNLNQAINSSSTDACGVLNLESSKMVCQKARFIQEVVAGGDLKKCNEIADENSKIICVSQASLSMAIINKDAKYCDNMAYPDDKISCLKIVNGANETSITINIVDTDKDGLSDSDEVSIYKSNPANPDTDGDGYKDGDEVEAGFSPVGAGKLE